MTRSACSDRPLTAPPGRLAVLEGLPGAGKTTIATVLRAAYPVIGEYTDTTGATTPLHAHPPVTADGAHQTNWLIKAKLAEAYLAANPLVICDRDWLSSLAYAYSVAHHDHGRLLAQRCAWALRHLVTGELRAPDTYLLLDITPVTSLARRAHRLRPGHPWSTPAGLERLDVFYRDPAHTLAAHAPALAEHLTTARFVHISANEALARVLDAVAAHAGALR